MASFHHTAVSVSKFVGTISLGLMTGITYTHTSTTLPSLLSLPSSTTAARTLSRLQTLTARHLRLLSTLSLVSLTLAYTLSPRRARHPYLLWTGLTVLVGSGGEWVASSRQHANGLVAARAGSEEVKAGQEWEEEEVVNGEVVRGEMERGRWVWGARTLCSGLAFGMSVVGIWGDGF